MLVRYTMRTKQYDLHNPKTHAFVKSHEVISSEETPFFQQTAEPLFMPLTKEEERVHLVMIKSQPTGLVTRSRAKIESEGRGKAESASRS